MSLSPCVSIGAYFIELELEKRNAIVHRLKHYSLNAHTNRVMNFQAVATINNNIQMYRQIMSPGWTLGWTWAKKEVIWSMVGGWEHKAQTKETVPSLKGTFLIVEKLSDS
ncbi:hypothetical protein Q3G72_011774 [Acer saccharum]|nr:hypothetical protein Q3G72_011774 [Acer saccharum]